MPPPAALAWYGGVGTTAGLSQLLLKFLNDFASVQDSVESLGLNVKDDLDLIEKFMTFVKDLPPDNASIFDGSVLDDLASYLQPLMIRCETEIRTIRAATDGKTRAEAYTSRLAIRAVEAIEKDLQAWVQRLNVRLSLLSEKVKLDAIRAVSNRDSALQFQYEMQTLSSEIHKLRANGQTIDYKHLWLPESQSVDFSNAPLQRRMTGLLANGKVLVEFVSYNAAASVEVAQEAIGELAFILNRSDPSIFHILKCTNLFRQSNASGRSATYGLIFELPSGLETIGPLSDIIAEAKEAQLRSHQSIARETLTPVVKKYEKARLKK